MDTRKINANSRICIIILSFFLSDGARGDRPAAISKLSRYLDRNRGVSRRLTKDSKIPTHDRTGDSGARRLIYRRTIEGHGHQSRDVRCLEDSHYYFPWLTSIVARA